MGLGRGAVASSTITPTPLALPAACTPPTTRLLTAIFSSPELALQPLLPLARTAAVALADGLPDEGAV